MITDPSTDAGKAVLLHDRCPTLTELASTAAELAARSPELCRVRTLGTSRAGRPLTLLSIGRAERDVLVVAGAHADEFAGRASTVELAHRVLARPALRTAATWHFLLCLDPDGAHLARGALTARTLPEYFAGYFRPAAEEQPEWAPAVGARLPESRILLDLIDELRPALQFTLHSMDVGGTFLQATCDPAALAAPFASSAAALGIPVETGTYDTFWLRESGPGVFLMEPHHIDRQETSTGMLTPRRTGRPAGTGVPDGPDGTARVRASTWFAPQRHGGETVIVEVPAWTSDRLGDTRPVDDAAACLSAGADRLRTRTALLAELLDAALPHLPADDTALLRAARSPLTAARQLADEWDPAALGRRLLRPGLMTRSKLAGIDLWAHRIPVRTAALLRRAVEPAGARAAGQAARLDALLQDWCARYQRRFRPAWLPVTRQAEHQANIVQAAVELRLTA
ncbi:M14 family zinc carboxypeptidase [Kitasatospora sp. NPDC093550]|uniref:M14 family zinc carboxypeptidase n=1 Tax=Kitasatospora sp. NPDC093550 TaxID=3364089 RepID=UPI0038257E4A